MVNSSTMRTTKAHLIESEVDSGCQSRFETMRTTKAYLIQSEVDSGCQK